jgi:hypothetical protein
LKTAIVIVLSIAGTVAVSAALKNFAPAMHAKLF